jgi:hypothetical protein
VTSEQVLLLIGGGQLLAVLLLWFTAARARRRKTAASAGAAPSSALRTSIPAVLAIGGLALACAGLYRTLTFGANASNIEQRIREWSKRLGLATTPQEGGPPSYFSLLITLGDGNQVVVSRPKEGDRDRFLSFRSRLILSPEHRAILVKMTKVQAYRAVLGLQMEMARYRIGFDLQMANPNELTSLAAAALTEDVPITSALTDAVFLEHVRNMDNAETLLRDAINLSLSPP